MASLAMTRFYKPYGPFLFSSQPRAVQHRKKFHTVSLDNKFFYKNDQYSNIYENSNNKAQAVPTLSSYSSFLESRTRRSGKPYGSHSSKKPERRSLERSSGRSDGKVRWRSVTPEPVEGRQHVQLQTELYLEELADVVLEQDQYCQTDLFLERPASPLFVPAKTGIDQGTQVLQGELFDFDVESKPVVEVLVGKVVEQSLLEVMQEEELASLKERQKVFEELRAAELQDQQRLEEEERRRKEEKLKRMKQQQEVLKKHRETAEKVAARAFAQGFLADLVPQVLASLTTHGFFCDPVEMEVERDLMEDLMRGVSKRLRQEVISRRMVELIVREVLVNRESFFLKMAKQESFECLERPDFEEEEVFQKSLRE